MDELSSRVATLEQLIEVYEQAVREQSDRLERLLATLSRHAIQLANSEEALRRQTQVLEMIVTNMNDGVVVADTKGKFITFNPAATSIFGVGPLEASADEWPERYGIYLADGTTLCPASKLPLVRAIGGETVAEAELLVRNPYRSNEVWLSVNANPLPDATGVVQGAVTVFRDVTERKQADKLLRDSEALYHSLVDTLPLCVLRKDCAGRFTYANRHFCDLMGRSAAEIVGRTDHDFYPPELAEKYVLDDRRVIGTQGVFEDIEEHQLSDGGRRYVQVIKAPVRDSEGVVVGVQIIFWDVTDRQRAEQELQKTAAELARSNFELERFAYVASHDMQEPLRMIASYLHLLQRRFCGSLGPDADEFITYSVDAANRLQQLIHDLLIYARVTTEERVMEPTSSAEAVRKALDNLRMSIGDSKARITCGELPMVRGDSVQLVQLFQNLLGNSIKFRSAEPPCIRVSAERVDGQWQFTICDNGIGIDAQYCEHVFGLFHRLHSTMRIAGSGIGLATCRRIVERHGGRIWIATEQRNGCTIHFTLPAGA